MKRSISQALLTALLLLACGCGAKLVAYEPVKDTQTVEFTAYGKHWTYRHNITGHFGPGIIAGHGFIGTQSTHHQETIEESPNTPIPIAERIVVAQSSGSFIAYAVGEATKHLIGFFPFEEKMYIVVKDKPEKITDIPIPQEIKTAYLDGEVEFFGEWNPSQNRFEVTRAFPKSIAKQISASSLKSAYNLKPGQL
jgi:hypothetical protein